MCEEKYIPVDAFSRRMPCECDEGHMVVDWKEDSKIDLYKIKPRMYPHVCDSCGKKEILPKDYPAITYRDQKNGELNLYVWKDVMRDYSTGMAFAIAYSYEEAVALAIGEDTYKEEHLVPSKCEKIPIKPYGASIYGGS